MNDETRVDIENLWEIGAYYLPSLAKIYGTAAGRLHQTRAKEANLFETPGMPAGTTSLALFSFQELRDQLQNVARSTCINLRDSGAGCVKAADDFSATDLSNADRLEYEGNKAEFGKNHTVTPPKNPPAPTDPVI